MISPDLEGSGWCVRANLPLVGNHLGAEFVVELGLPNSGDQHPQPLRLVLEEQTLLCCTDRWLIKVELKIK